MIEPLRRGFGRLAWAVCTTIGSGVVVWLATMALPADPAAVVLGSHATPDGLAELRARMGLDRPLLIQISDWVAGLLRGDLGTSLVSGESATPLILDRAVNSAAIVAATMLIIGGVGVPIGVWAAMATGPADRALSTTALASAAIPDFVLGTLLIGWLAIGLGWLPALSLIPPGDTAWQHPARLVLPALALGLPISGWVARYVRAVVREHARAPYVNAARAAGLSRRSILARHLLPAALAPVVQFLGWTIAMLLGGAVVVEHAVGFPGLGSLLVESVNNRDLPVVAAITVVMAATVSIALLVSDLLAAALDPRLRPWRH